MRGSDTPLLTDLLKAVSRSFYITLRVLPASVRPQIGLAYLLARTTDTIADTNLVPVATRLEALASLRQFLLGEGPAQDWSSFAPSPTSSDGAGVASVAETALLRRIPDMVTLLGGFSAWDQERIRTMLDVITGGQILDLERFGDASETRVVALTQAEELDDYTYRVAGCVGEFWTHLCRRHVFPQAPIEDATLLAEGVRFGKGLQLVNVLRDLPRDLRQGRCYLPSAELAGVGLEPKDLLDPSAEPALRKVFDVWLGTARDHLTTGWRYTCRLPVRARRIRLACAWPLLIGIQTLNRLQAVPILDPAQRVKVTRPEVRRILGRSLALLPWRRAWERQFEKLAGAAKSTAFAPESG